MKRGPPFCSVLFWAAAVLYSIAGCAKPHKVGEVDGTVVINGQPGHKLRVQFVPDIDRGTKGPISIAETDSQGRFTLELKDPQSTAPTPGAIVGWHRVMLSDLQLAESPTGQGVPIRFGPEYTQPGSTPLRQEVKEGKQEIEIKVP